MATKSKSKKYVPPTPAQRKANDAKARELLAALTPAQLNEVGAMFGMSNLGCDYFDRPESLAESEEMYDMFMEEICDWQQQLKQFVAGKKLKMGGFGCFLNELPEMIAEAVKRYPNR